MRFKIIPAAVVGVAALVLALACGGSDEESRQPSPVPETSRSTSGSVAPNVFMTFEGQRYRAVDVGTDLVGREDVEVAGTTDDIDIDQTGPVEVYRLESGSSESLYTFQAGRFVPEAEGGSIPDVWMEWSPAEQTGAQPPLPPDRPVEATPAPDQSVPVESEPIDAARAHLADRLGVEVEAIEVVSVEPVDWPNACVGAARPGEACAEVITPGYRVLLAADSTEYVYHTDTNGHVRPSP